MGRSRGGVTTKIHVVTDAAGLPIRHDLSPGLSPLDDMLLHKRGVRIVAGA